MGEVAVGGGADESGGRGVRREGFLPQASVRVLLVEADDSTRRIIAALLRKCGYRVAAAVDDGLKAWKTLKENSQNIDLVLAEVDLPSLSGYGLLTMMMEHEISKNIPSIMMSSRDSINMVSKCILKGAADFLVKPIRKNELRNLWQHVWRRHSSDGIPGGKLVKQYENPTQPMDEAKLENNSASSFSRDHIMSPKKNSWCSEKECDTQHSFTRSGMEGESAYMRNMPDSVQPDCVSSSVINDVRNCKDDVCDKLDDEIPVHGSETEAGCIGDGNIQSEEKDKGYCQHKPFGEVDLLGAMDNRSWCNQEFERCHEVQDETFKDAEFSSDAKNQNWCPLLGLSLERYQPINSENQEKDGLTMLNHSSSSPFSRYFKTMTSPLSMSSGFRKTVPNVDVYEQSREKGLPQSNTSQCNGAPLHLSLEDGDSAVDGQSSHNRRAPCSHLGPLPKPVPMTGAVYSGPFYSYSPLTLPVCDMQSGTPVWSLKPTNEEAANSTLSHQSDKESFNSVQHDHDHDRNGQKQLRQQKKENICNVESSNEKSHSSSVTGQSTSDGILSGSKSHLNSSARVGVCDGGNGNLTASNASWSTMDSTEHERNGFFTYDGIKLAESCRSIEREVALHKFRLKRKERCFEKKVRYQSRKRLAEERPRVKGQFVRRVQCDT